MSLLGRIDELRKQYKKLSINKLEQECGLTRGSMAKWDDHAPSPDKVKKVADYFNVSVEYLLYGVPSAGIKKDPIREDGAEISEFRKRARELVNNASDEDLKNLLPALERMLRQ